MHACRKNESTAEATDGRAVTSIKTDARHHVFRSTGQEMVNVTHHSITEDSGTKNKGHSKDAFFFFLFNSKLQAMKT